MLKGSGLESKDIDTDKRTINLGLWHLAIYFFEPHHNFILCMLTEWYGYTCYEETFNITSTWCDRNAEHIHERFKVHNDEYNQRLKAKLNNNYINN